MKAKKSKVNRIVNVAIAAMICYVAVSLLVLQADISSYRRRLSDLEAQCEEQDGKPVLSFAGYTLPLDDRRAAVLKAQGYLGKTVILGIRTENLREAGDEIRLRIDAHKIHIFDKDTEKTITN